MENDPRQALTLAFQHLDTFSVPGVGTFRRSYFPALIDTKAGKISPPGERFVYESGEKFVEALEAFYAKRFTLDMAGAKDLVAKVKLWMVKGLKGGGRLALEGVGTMELTGGKVLKFDAEESLATQAPDFFGLTAVDFGGEKKKDKKPAGGALAAAAVAGAAALSAVGEGESGKGKEKEKQKEEKKKVEAKKGPVLEKKKAEAPKEEEKKKEKVAAVAPVAPVTPNTPPVTPETQEPEGEERKKRRGFGWIILALLLIGFAVAGYVWQDEVNQKLTEWGLIGGKSNETVVVADSSDTDSSGQDMAIEPIDTVLEEDLVITDGSGDDGSDNVVNDPSVGSYAVAGQYYLVVGSTYNSDQAKRLARETGGKIIKPRYKGNYYRIYIHKSASKDDVIGQMVAQKEKFSNSWIFWLGM